MSNGTTRQRDWTDRDDKLAAILDVMKYIMKDKTNYAIGKAGVGVGNDSKANDLFRDPKIGNINIPANGRVVIFDPGETKLHEASSLIIELPSEDKVGTQMDDTALASHAIGNYNHWVPL
jgi:hypothetical protein